jgi:hypothetical protein
LASRACGKKIADFCALSIQRVLRQFKVNAETAAIEFKRLTVADDEPGYRAWRKAIRDYRNAAGARAKELVRA